MISTVSFVTIGSACLLGMALAQDGYAASAYAPQHQSGYAAPQQQYGYAAPEQQYGYAAPQQQYGYAAPQQQYGYAAPKQQYGYGDQAYKPSSSGSFFAAKVKANENRAYITKNTNTGTWSNLNVDDHTTSLNNKHVKLGEMKDQHEVTRENSNHNNVDANAKYFQKGYPVRHGGGYDHQQSGYAPHAGYGHQQSGYAPHAGYGHQQSGYAPHAGYGRQVYKPSGSYYGVKANLRGNDASFSKNTTVGTWSNLHVDDYTTTYNDNKTKFDETKDKQEDITEKYHNTDKYGNAEIISKKYGKNGRGNYAVPSPYA